MTLIVEERPEIVDLIDRVLAGDRVTVTRGGKPVADLVPTAAGYKLSTLDVDWLMANIIEPDMPVTPGEKHIVQQMREESRF